MMNIRKNQDNRFNRTTKIWWLLIGLVVAGFYVGIRPLHAANAVVGTGTPASCTEGTFDSALFAVQNSGGGTITFDCGDNVHIIVFIAGFTGKIIDENVIIDGQDKIIVNAFNERRHFYVNPGGNLTLQNIHLIQGRNNIDGGGSIYNLGALTLENTTITDSNADINQTSGATGGAIKSVNGTVTIIDSRLENNTAASGGGLALDGELADATITNSIFRNNRTTNSSFGFGGGIATWDGADVTIRNSILESNEAKLGGAVYSPSVDTTVSIEAATNLNSNSAAQQGGGIYNHNGIIIVDNSGLSENTAPLGGGILNSGTITVSNSTLASNSAVEGGGIWNESTLTISDSTLADNMASNIGGGIFNSSSDSGGTITVSNSTFSSNSAVNAGGGIATYNMLEMGNSTFSGNTANAGGGIFNKVGTSDIESSTLSDNSANSGSGVYNSEGSTTLSNSIIANSMNGSDCFGTIIDAGYNLVEDNSCGFSGGSDPKLGPLADNGGATWTHALLPGSPLSNLIPPGSCMLTADQRGVARPQNTNCDVGAYELWQLNIGVNSPSELTLIWENAAANCVYDVYEETTPYFTPTNATYTGQSSGVVYPQLGDVVTNYFYVVAAMCDGVSPGGGTTAVSNTVGEFDFALVTSN